MEIANFKIPRIFYTCPLVVMKWGKSRILWTESSHKVTNKHNASILTIWYLRCSTAYANTLDEISASLMSRKKNYPKDCTHQ